MPGRSKWSYWTSTWSLIEVPQRGFRAKRQMAFLPYVMMTRVCCRSSSITKWAARIFQEQFDLESPKCAKQVKSVKNQIIRPLFIRRSVTKFHTNIHADLLNSRTGYVITSYFRSAVIANKSPKMWSKWLWVKFEWCVLPGPTYW